MNNVHVEEVYLLMLERQNGDVVIAKDGALNGDKIVVAREGNQKYLEIIGDRLLQEELILGYQLLKTAGLPHRGYEIVEPEATGLGLPSGYMVLEA